MQTGSGSRYYINTGTSDVSIDIGAAQPTAMNSDAFYIYSDSDNVANAYSTGIASGGYEGSLSVSFHVTFSIYGRNEYGDTTNQGQERASIYYAISTDGGITFGSAVRITRQYLAWDEEFGSDDNPDYRVHIYGSEF
ncbi:MAG: hypothetical protein IJ831_09425 [Spirochaetales bacterium]|nr:hypothetical protein [Spirochaetales bacterium]